MRTAAIAVRREWGLAWGAVRSGLAERGWRALTLTSTALCLIVLFQVAQRQGNRSWSYRIVEDVGFVRAVDSWWLALVRTPLSVFVPAVDLPVWGALVQVLVVFGIAEITLGPRRTLLVAYLCTLTGVLYARMGVAIGPGGVLGLPVSDAQVVDTGPSGAVAGLTVYLCLRFRAWCTGAFAVVALVVEALVDPDLAGREHLVAVVTASALFAYSELRGGSSSHG
ncbi:hypothetical protein [Streptomyces sp. NPDC056796]|uniref:hypothetical protein n=1 Tax=unclassified Streptomyces TaxID=2593676 RepID=UPI0036800EC8